MPKKANKSATKSRYSPHPMLHLEDAFKAKLRTETGKTWDQWLVTARQAKLTKSRELSAWLREKHGLSMMRAYQIASAALAVESGDYDDPERLVAELYQDRPAALRAIHEAVVDAALALGSDVIVTACKTLVPIYRKHVFAELRPLESAVEVMLALGDHPGGKRVEVTKGRSSGDRATHRVLLSALKDVNAEFRKLLAAAYELGAGKIVRAATELELPADFSRELKGPAAKTWETMTAAMRRDMVSWIEQAKQAETRTRRINTSLEKLRAGQKRVY